MKDGSVSSDNMNDDRLIMDFIKKRKRRRRAHGNETAHNSRNGTYLIFLKLPIDIRQQTNYNGNC